MKPTVLVVLTLCLFISAPAQQTSEGQLIIQRKCRSEHAAPLQGRYGQQYPELIREIRVLDARPDTSRIGIVRAAWGQSEIKLASPVANELSKYLNNAYSRSKGGHSLLIVVKDLWITSPDGYVPGGGIFAGGHRKYYFRFHVEAYLAANDGCMPLISMDTTTEDREDESAPGIARKAIGELFDEFMDRIAAKDLDRERRLVSTEQIDSFNESRFAYPMDTAIRMTKGVYRTFEEFLQNAPSIGNAEFSRDNTGNYSLRIPDENGQLYYTHTVWGYCDGDHAYAMMDGNLFPIFEIHHQFYVLGSKEYRLKGGIFVPFFVPLGPVAVVGYTHINQEVARSLRVFRIDNGTGLVIE